MFIKLMTETNADILGVIREVPIPARPG